MGFGIEIHAVVAEGTLLQRGGKPVLGRVFVFHRMIYRDD